VAFGLHESTNTCETLQDKTKVTTEVQ